MRFIYDNQIDSLVASQLTALTTFPLYEATKVQDERLTTQWRSTSPTSQTFVINAGGVVVEGETRQPMFQATTNLIPSPENLTSDAWTTSGTVITTAGTVLGMQLNKVTATDSGATFMLSAADIGFTDTTGTVSFVARKGNTTALTVFLRDQSAGSASRFDVAMDFVSKTITYGTGSEAMPPEWIDDETVRIFGKTAGLVPANTNTLWLYPRGVVATGAIGEYGLYTAAMAVDNTFPLGYTASARTAWGTAGTVAYRLPPSGKFIVDCEFFPYFNYDTTDTIEVWNWFVASAKSMRFFYNTADDKFQLNWDDDGTVRFLTHDTAFDSGTELTINQSLRLTFSFNLTTGLTTGQRMYVIPRTQGSLQETTAWNSTPAILSTTFPTLIIGNRAGNEAQSFFSYLRIYGGNLEDTITTEAHLDAELSTKQLTYSSDYQKRFNVDTLAILGHEISAEADIKVEVNDWDEWNYTDGSGSSIIQNTMTWDAQTILTFLDSKVKREYVRFSINDPNNDNADIRVGRFWVGDYLDVSPSSLLNFSVTKQTSDRMIYGRNRQKWSDEGAKWRKFDLQFPRTPDTSAQSMLSKIQRMYDNVGNAHSLIFANFDTVRDYKIVEPVYASIVGPITFNHRASQKYEYSITLEEDK